MQFSYFTAKNQGPTAAQQYSGSTASLQPADKPEAIGALCSMWNQHIDHLRAQIIYISHRLMQQQQINVLLDAQRQQFKFLLDVQNHQFKMQLDVQKPRVAKIRLKYSNHVLTQRTEKSQQS